MTCPVAKEVIYTLKEREYVEQIEKAYSYASKVLLDFLMEEKELVAHLRFAFFLDHRSVEALQRVLFVVCGLSVSHVWWSVPVSWDIGKSFA